MAQPTNVGDENLDVKKDEIKSTNEPAGESDDKKMSEGDSEEEIVEEKADGDNAKEEKEEEKVDNDHKMSEADDSNIKTPTPPKNTLKRMTPEGNKLTESKKKIQKVTHYFEPNEDDFKEAVEWLKKFSEETNTDDSNIKSQFCKKFISVAEHFYDVLVKKEKISADYVHKQLQNAAILQQNYHQVIFTCIKELIEKTKSDIIQSEHPNMNAEEEKKAIETIINVNIGQPVTFDEFDTWLKS